MQDPKTPWSAGSVFPSIDLPSRYSCFLSVDFFQDYPKWSPEVDELERLTDGPMLWGSIACLVRVDQRHRSPSRFRVTRFEPRKGSCPAGLSDPYRCTYELYELTSENTTRLTFAFELLELLVFMRPFEKLIRITIQDGAESAPPKPETIDRSKYPGEYRLIHHLLKRGE